MSPSRKSSSTHKCPNRSSDLSLNKPANGFDLNKSGQINDLEEAIELQRASLGLCSEGHPDLSGSLSDLAAILSTRYQQCERGEDLEEIIKLHQAALNLMPEDDPDRPMSLNNLGDSLRSRFEKNGRSQDLDAAIDLQQAAVDLEPEGQPSHPASLSNLAGNLRTRFNHRGMAEDLEEAIELDRVALELRPEGHPERSMSLNNLAGSLFTRSREHERIEDLNDAIDLHRAALKLRPRGHPDFSMSLNNLAVCLYSRFQFVGETEDLDEAVQLNQTASELHSKGHRLYTKSLTNAAHFLETGSSQYEKPEDLDKTVELYRAALELHPKEALLHPGRLSNLASSLRKRFEQHGRIEDIEEAINLHRLALELRPEGHPERSSSLTCLAYSLYARIEQRWCKEEFEECVELLKLAVTHRFSGATARLIAAKLWTSFALHHGHSSAFIAYKSTVSVLQHALSINPTLHEQHEFLLRDEIYSILTKRTASCAIGKDCLELAIEILEQGRGLLWSQLRDFRTPLDQLAETNKELVDNFMNVSRQLENLAKSRVELTATSTRDGGRSLRLYNEPGRKYFDELLKVKRELSTQQEGIINEIRGVPGFENFLEAMPFKLLQQAASEGPVIVVNFGITRSDALIILVYIFASISGKTHRQFGADSAEYDKELRGAMKMLWDRVVSKVVVKLKEHGIAEGSRIWWCPTFILSILPFHAAGPFEDEDGTWKYLLDKYISSYTPTLGALINARSGGSGGEPTVLVIGDTSLRSAKQEIRNIRNCGISTKLLVGKKVSRDAVVKDLREVTWVHFVCHGQLNQDPFDASFNLSDGGLTLLDIVQDNLPNAEFAFLSACHTAEQSHNGAHDEVLHLTAAMQFSGFRSVIGSMWELLDKDGPAFAKTVYEYMNNCEEGEVKYKRAAAGLRKAAIELKAREGIATERWVNLVNIGAELQQDYEKQNGIQTEQ
ncbi:TPR-like protein [Fomitiporia mediterranea MF3/22]|uniref:TPR-like protein n=1 Tax=Fomitiporia mediterranea (strain MF3/22) TaxID=694068 RepID=UPI0004409321|nr:TPR-like protein [Fomitiporia mediterranea MF3/22]EJD03273.1 TPR-like protein [Fomitiporia mediterranea MF3/22]